MKLLSAETSAREMGVVDLGEALEIVVLVAEVDPEKSTATPAFLARLADERRLRLAELDLAVTALRALPSPRARDALRALLQHDGASWGYLARMMGHGTGCSGTQSLVR